MRIEGLIWLEEIVEKLEIKHRVKQYEIRELLDGDPHFQFVEKGHRPGENVYAALGRARSGRFLIVFFVYRKDRRALVVSARDMTSAERKRYEKR